MVNLTKIKKAEEFMKQKEREEQNNSEWKGMMEEIGIANINLG